MEILKSKSLLVAILLIANSVFAQTAKEMQLAFSKSYEYEITYNYTEAIKAIKTIYSDDNYETNLRLGWLHYLSGKQTESAAYYKKAISLRPYGIEARLGYVLPLSSLGNWETIKTEYFEILSIDPKNTTANYRLGYIYYYNKDYKNALKYFEICANLYPFDYDFILMYAWTNFQLGKTREAQVLFNKVLLIKPNDASALEGLGLLK